MMGGTLNEVYPLHVCRNTNGWQWCKPQVSLPNLRMGVAEDRAAYILKFCPTLRVHDSMTVNSEATLRYDPSIDLLT